MPKVKETLRSLSLFIKLTEFQSFSSFQNRLDHWSMEFGHCLIFVNWCLEFSQLKKSTVIRYPTVFFL